MIPRRQYDMTIALSPPYYRTAAIVLSHCRIVVIVLARFRNRTNALSPSYYRTVVIVLSRSRILALWILMSNHGGPNGILYSKVRKIWFGITIFMPKTRLCFISSSLNIQWVFRALNKHIKIKFMFLSVEVLVNSRSKEHNKTLIGLTNLRQEKTHRAIIYNI